MEVIRSANVVDDHTEDVVLKNSGVRLCITYDGGDVEIIEGKVVSEISGVDIEGQISLNSPIGKAIHHKPVGGKPI